MYTCTAYPIPDQNWIHFCEPPAGAGGGRLAMFSLAREEDGGAGILPFGPGAAASDKPAPPVPAPGDFVLFFRGIFMETYATVSKVEI